MFLDFCIILPPRGAAELLSIPPEALLKEHPAQRIMGTSEETENGTNSEKKHRHKHKHKHKKKHGHSSTSGSNDMQMQGKQKTAYYVQASGVKQGDALGALVFLL